MGGVHCQFQAADSCHGAAQAVTHSQEPGPMASEQEIPEALLAFRGSMAPILSHETKD